MFIIDDMQYSGRYENRDRDRYGYGDDFSNYPSIERDNFFFNNIRAIKRTGKIMKDGERLIEAWLYG